MTALARLFSSFALSAALIAPALASESFRLDHQEVAAGVDGWVDRQLALEVAARADRGKR